MKKNVDDNYIYSWFDCNVDLINRTIYMGSISKDDCDGESGVDSFMAEYFIKGMHLLESNNKEKEILILMNNPGGDWYHGMAIFDSIKGSSCFCIIKVYGHAMSMGSIILQAADKRIMMPNSKFMIHYGYDNKGGHSKVFEKWGDESKRINYEMENLYLDKIMAKEELMGNGYLESILSKIMTRQKSLEIPKSKTISYKFSNSLNIKREEVRCILKEMLNFDTILNAKETVDLGLADEIFTNNYE